MIPGAVKSQEIGSGHSKQGSVLQRVEGEGAAELGESASAQVGSHPSGQPRERVPQVCRTNRFQNRATRRNAILRVDAGYEAWTSRLSCAGETFLWQVFSFLDLTLGRQVGPHALGARCLSNRTGSRFCEIRSTSMRFFFFPMNTVGAW